MNEMPSIVWKMSGICKEKKRIEDAIMSHSKNG